jgi:D-alanyl-D-alanine endopeptidase (penicillin-binding protein 7)
MWKPVTGRAPTPDRSTVITRPIRRRILLGIGAALVALQGQAASPSADLAAVDGRVPRLWEHLDPGELRVESKAALVVDEFGNPLYAKDADTQRPIASITKLMTAMVVLDGRQDLNEVLKIGSEDRDRLRGTRSRLAFGTALTREQMLKLALMSSENRAAAALARHYRGGSRRFVTFMNLKAEALRLRDTLFADPTGLSEDNVSTPRDLARMVRAAQRYPLIREATTSGGAHVRPAGRGASLNYVNTNPLIRNSSRHWRIGVSKTGYLNAAGHCLVMQADIGGQFVVLVLMDSGGKLAATRDANRIRIWLERGIAAARRVRAQHAARKNI